MTKGIKTFCLKFLFFITNLKSMNFEFQARTTKNAAHMATVRDEETAEQRLVSSLHNIIDKFNTLANTLKNSF